MDNYLSPQTIEHKKRPRNMEFEIQFLDCGKAQKSVGELNQ